ncbi:type II secretion system F family protein [Nocardiopsis sp. NPDC049922]|uniref:type II secretion system F family protein n=1 Tax=Nocardiopsis sp. NPDC049922 TaxID=3155157 RepID=UPI0034015EB9
MTVLLVCLVSLVLLSLPPGANRVRLAHLCPPPGTVRAEAGRTEPREAGRREAPWSRAVTPGASRLDEGPLGGAVRRWFPTVAHRRGGARRRRAVIVLCRVLATELRAGQPPDEALLVSVAEAGPPVEGVVDAHSMRATAEGDPDLWALAYLAVCWEVSAETGAGLAEIVDALAAELTDHEERRAEIAARTAGPRTTALVLGGLPLVGVLMSVGLGGSPLEFLFTTPLGAACLVGGVTLDLLGTWWTSRMVRRAVGSAGGQAREPPGAGDRKRTRRTVKVVG